MAVAVTCSPSWNWVSPSAGCFAVGEAHISVRRSGRRFAVAGWGSTASLKCAGKSWMLASRIPRIPVLDGYLLAEMVPAFFVALGVGTTLGLSLGALVGLVRQVVASGLPFGVAVRAAVLHAPVFVSQTLPLACMAASLFGLGRFKADNEIVALLAAGVPMWRMLVAPLLLSGAAALLKVACNDVLVPLGSSQARKMVEAAMTTDMQSLRQTRDIVYPQYGKVNVGEGQADETYPSSLTSETVLQRIWYARRMDGGKMSGLLILEVSPTGQVESLVLAESCEWNPRLNVWKFLTTTVLPVSQQALNRLILQVDCLAVPGVGLAPLRSRWSSSPREFSRSQFLEHIAILEATSTSGTRGEGTRNTGGIAKGVINPPLRNVEGNTIPDDDAVIRAKCMFFQRDSAAFSCIIYGLIGATSTLAVCTSATSSKRRTMPFVIALISALVYNGLAALSGAAGFASILPPIFSAWLPIPFGVFLGLSMFWLMK